MNERKIHTSLPGQIADLKGKSVVLAGDALLDPPYLAYVYAIAKAFDMKLMINKVDFMYLQRINGGCIPDEMGVTGIDADCSFQHETVAQNDAELRPRLRLDAPILSMIGSLILTYEMLDRGVVDLYEYGNQYLDGICFLQTGDPDKGDSRLGSFDAVYGWQSVIADLLKGEQEHDYWNTKLAALGFDRNHVVDDFLVRQMYTRVGCIGRSAKTKEPLLAYNPWTIAWLNKSGLGQVAGPPLEQRFPILAGAIINNSGAMSVGEMVDFIDSRLTHTMVRDSIERDRAFRGRLKSEEREDWLLLVLNLVLGSIPGVSQLTGVMTHLYQRHRAKKNDT